jgi:hypothetical protein
MLRLPMRKACFHYRPYTFIICILQPFEPIRARPDK